MKYHLAAILTIFLANHNLFSQNYVVNGSFERTNKNLNKTLKKPASCAFTSTPETFNNFMEAWHTFQLVTPDLLINAPQGDSCRIPLPAAHTGERYLGLIMYHPGSDSDHEYDYHEYVEGSLAKPLTPGKKYRVSYWVHSGKDLGRIHLQNLQGIRIEVEPVLCGNFGFYFSTEISSPKENYRRSIFDFDLKPQINTESVVDAGTGWKKISMTFVPDKPFKYFVFGNFASDAITATDLPEEQANKIYEGNISKTDNAKKVKRIGYYCFDDFSVVEEDVAKANEVAKTEKNIAQQLEQDKRYTFSAALLFDFGKSDLKPAAFGELDQVVQYLSQNPNISLNIRGHTDNIGGPSANQKLSEARAEAVFTYLAQKGIDRTRLQHEGLGETEPVAENNAEEGRAKNRRVDISTVQH